MHELRVAFERAGRVLLRDDWGLRPLRVAEVLRFEAEPGGVRVHTDAGSFYLRETLDALESFLGDRTLRSHRSELLMIGRIDRFESREDGRYQAVLDDGTERTVSRAVSIELRRAAL
jgi:two-component system LytT family response regulator